MERIAEVEIRKADKPVFCRVPDDVAVSAGEMCIIEVGQGHLEAGRILKFLDQKTLLRPPTAGKVVRTMSREDILAVAENAHRKPEAVRICREKIAELSLPLKLIDVEYSFDRSRIVVYYWAEGRVDFRRLVRELAGIFNCRIEMRQIGLRDEARMKGGCGICGRTLCCATFLRSFESITMRMVKNQKMPLDMNKITGLCGRLMCCISYEDASYREARDREKAGKP